MSVLKDHAGELLIILCLVVGGTQTGSSESPKVPTTWWPDPSTGLMWTGQSSFQLRGPMAWDEAGSYCSSLTLGGFSGWRLPTLDEVRGAEHFYPVTETDKNGFDQTIAYLGMKGGISTSQLTRIWTSTPGGGQQYVSVFMGPPDVARAIFKPKLWEKILDPAEAIAHEHGSKVSDHNAILCVRSMEPDLLQIAKDAQAYKPVPDLLTLKANVPLYKARQAFQSHDYQTAITQAQSALAIKPDFAEAYWGIGISYGSLGQWDQAISNLDSALKIDKNYDAAKIALKWVKDNQKSAKQGKATKPLWN
jgi:hypothetical protein